MRFVVTPLMERHPVMLRPVTVTVVAGASDRCRWSGGSFCRVKVLLGGRAMVQGVLLPPTGGNGMWSCRFDWGGCTATQTLYMAGFNSR